MTQTDLPPDAGVAFAPLPSQETSSDDGDDDSNNGSSNNGRTNGNGSHGTTDEGAPARGNGSNGAAARPPSARTRPWWRRGRREILGVAGAVLGFLGFSLHYALATEPLAPPDEHAHLSYGYYVAGGDLPEIDSWNRFPGSATHMAKRVKSLPDDPHRTVWVANHPPLYYVAIAPLLSWTDGSGNANAGLVAARLLSVAFAAAGMVVTYRLAVEVSGGLRQVGVAAAALAGLVVQAQYAFGDAYNDALAFLTTTLMLWAAVRCVRRAPPPRSALLLGLALAAASATRAAGLVVGVAVLLTVVGVRTLRDGRRAARPARLAVMHAAVLALPTVVLVGWFYLRNVVLYGDIGGSSYLLDRFDREPLDRSLMATAFDGGMWRYFYDRMVGYSRFSATVHLSEGTLSLWRWGVVVAALGALLAVVLGRAGGRRDDGRPARLSQFGMLVLLLAVLANCAVLVQHFSGGGSPYPRYLTPTLGAMATMAAIGLHRLLPRLLPLAAVLGAGATSIVLARPSDALEELLGDPIATPWLLSATLWLALLGIVLTCAVLVLPPSVARAEWTPDDNDRRSYWQHLRQVRVEEPDRAPAHGRVLQQS